jgi:hypothetical protein
MRSTVACRTTRLRRVSYARPPRSSRVWLGRGPACCILALVAGWVQPARAAELELSEPALCTSVDELSFRVSRAIAQPFERVSGPHFAVAIRQDAQGVHARLEISATGAAGGAGSSAERLLNAANCDEMADALALAIALALGSSVAAPEPSAPATLEPPTPTPPPVLASPPDSMPSPAVQGSDEPGPRLSLELAALADTGSLPGAGLGASLGVGLRWPLLELRAHGLWLPARHAQVDAADPASPGADLSLLAGAVLACTALSEARLIDVSACAGAELGRISGEGDRVSTPHTERRLWAAARVDLAGRWALPGSPLGLELLVTMAAPLLRDEFVLKDIGTVHQPPNVVGRAALGLAWQFE